MDNIFKIYAPVRNDLMWGGVHSGPRGGNFKKSQCFESGSKLVFYKIDTFGHSVLFTRAKNLLRSRFGEPRKIANMVKNQIHYLDPIKT